MTFEVVSYRTARHVPPWPQWHKRNVSCGNINGLYTVQRFLQRLRRKGIEVEEPKVISSYFKNVIGKTKGGKLAAITRGTSPFWTTHYGGHQGRPWQTAPSSGIEWALVLGQYAAGTIRDHRILTKVRSRFEEWKWAKASGQLCFTGSRSN